MSKYGAKKRRRAPRRRGRIQAAKHRRFKQHLVRQKAGGHRRSKRRLARYIAARFRRDQRRLALQKARRPRLFNRHLAHQRAHWRGRLKLDKLPAELRVEIFRYSLISSSPLGFTFGQDSNGAWRLRLIKPLPNERPAFALLFVSRLFFVEAREILYRENTFGPFTEFHPYCCHHNPPRGFAIRDFFHQIGDTNVKLLSRLRIWFPLMIFHTPNNDLWPGDQLCLSLIN